MGTFQHPKRSSDYNDLFESPDFKPLKKNLGAPYRHALNRRASEDFSFANTPLNALVMPPHPPSFILEHCLVSDYISHHHLPPAIFRS